VGAKAGQTQKARRKPALHPGGADVTIAGNMRSIMKSLPLAVLLLLAAGCSTTSITNLTPRQLPRSNNDLYRFEASWKSRQQTLRKESLKAYVVIGTELYLMKPTPVVANHWETFVPVPADTDVVNYRYKFDFDYNSIPQRRSNSKMSRPYQLKLLPPP
jgi:hypothetical protein